MSDLAAQLVVILNAIANAFGHVLLAPVSVLPGWLSITLVSAVTGVILLVVFKHTSNQRAIKRARDRIKENLLAIKLFKDEPRVAVRSLAAIFASAGALLALSLAPMAVMCIPVVLTLAQLSLWYQARPLKVGEETVLSLAMDDRSNAPLADVQLEPASALAVTVGPVRVRSERLVVWKVQALQAGYHRLALRVGGQRIEKELAVGEGFLRVSPRRPQRRWLDAIENPAEASFPRCCGVRSIEIEYPRRAGWASGSDSWVIYWFVVSMAAGLCFKRVFNVNM